MLVAGQLGLLVDESINHWVSFAAEKRKKGNFSMSRNEVFGMRMYSFMGIISFPAPNATRKSTIRGVPNGTFAQLKKRRPEKHPKSAKTAKTRS